jgi:hypothetical protein
MAHSRPVIYQAAQHHRLDVRQHVAPDRRIIAACNLGDLVSVQFVASHYRFMAYRSASQRALSSY